MNDRRRGHRRGMNGHEVLKQHILTHSDSPTQDAFVEQMMSALTSFVLPGFSRLSSKIRSQSVHHFITIILVENPALNEHSLRLEVAVKTVSLSVFSDIYFLKALRRSLSLL